MATQFKASRIDIVKACFGKTIRLTSQYPNNGTRANRKKHPRTSLYINANTCIKKDKAKCAL